VIRDVRVNADDGENKREGLAIGNGLLLIADVGIGVREH
jgi:hypothetical protein